MRAGENIKIALPIKGWPVPTASWQHGDKDIYKDDRNNIEVRAVSLVSAGCGVVKSRFGDACSCGFYAYPYVLVLITAVIIRGVATGRGPPPKKKNQSTLQIFIWLLVFFYLIQDKFDIVPVCALARFPFTYLPQFICPPK